MHLLVRESRGLDAIEEAVDLGQSPADVVVLSFTDSDLGAVASAQARRLGQPDVPTLRVASLQKLRHPGSVDLYVDTVLEHARFIVVRLLGGLDYWRYGAEQLSRMATASGAHLALVPGDGKDDPRLAELSTIDPQALAQIQSYWDQGGARNMDALLQYLARAIGRSNREPPLPASVSRVGFYRAGGGACCPTDALDLTGDLTGSLRPQVLIVFYRSLILADDTLPIDSLIETFRGKSIEALAIFINSLKDPESALWVERVVRTLSPGVIMNATAFSAKREEQERTALDVGNVPVLQVILSGAVEEAWQESSRGLSAADLVMNAVLPELDGRLLAGPISFKSEVELAADLEWPLLKHKPHADRLAAAVRKACGWLRLAAKPRAERKVALILSDYPGGGRAAHAVGLDGPASALAILQALKADGYGIGELPITGKALVTALATRQTKGLCLQDYSLWLAEQPCSSREAVSQCWGDPDSDPNVRDDTFWTTSLTFGNVLVAIQPDRGSSLDRKADYHDPDLPPRHGYLAFYAELHQRFRMDAMIHLGTHGTLEWLPGKAVALANSCFPEVVTNGTPVLYPFIVNNPGEAAAAKRRLSAVTIGHLTPPLAQSVITGHLADVERLVDDYAAADGLDKRRMRLLREEIVATANEFGLAEECGIAPTMGDEETVAQLDAYLCDLKDLQIRDGLHVFGMQPDGPRALETARALGQSSTLPHGDLIDLLDRSARDEMGALIDGLDGRFVPPGPAGAPTRGRIDVLPTGRNLYTVDPRAVPTRTAYRLGELAADEIVRRYLQDHGDYPSSVVIDLWGSATMRTGGDDLGQALALLGIRPVWDSGSSRVSGIEIKPLAEMDRPRIPVTLRISGLFRDVFETQIRLFDDALHAVAALDEDPAWNPLSGRPDDDLNCIFGPAPGTYGSGLGDRLVERAWSDRSELGAAYLSQSGFVYGSASSGRSARETFARKLAGADLHVQVRDNAEMDILDRTTYGEFQGGAAAAAESQGGKLTLYQLDTARPETPKARTLQEEVTRVIRGRAANPQWIKGQMRHGYAGAAEFANTLDALFAEAATTALPFSTQFDLYYDATLGAPEVNQFMADNNPQARLAMADKFLEAIERAIWQPRRNSVVTHLETLRHGEHRDAF